MRRHRAGSFGTAGRRQLPSPRPEPVGPAGPALSQAPNPKEKARRMVRLLRARLRKPRSRPAPGPARRT